MESLVKKRDRAKASISRIGTFITTHLTDDDVNINEFILREAQLVKEFDTYTDLQDQIDDLTDSNDIDDSDRFNTENIYFKLLATLKSFIQEHTQQSQVHYLVDNDPDDRSVGSAEPLPSLGRNAQVKLPNIEIPCFSGKVEEWTAFIDLFTALIDSNSQLSSVQKLLYLKSSLKHEPLDMINSLPVTNDNYSVALDLLKKRFDKKFPIINSHIKGLLDVPVVTKDNSVLLRQFITQVNKNLKSLQALNVPVESWDLLLIHVYSKNLSYYTKQAFEMEREVNELPTLTDFLNFLEKRCSTLEALSSNESNAQYKQKFTRQVHLVNESPQTKNNDNNFSPHLNGCLYCKQRPLHSIYRCIKFARIPASERKLFIIKNKYCLNCFSTQHMISQCPSDKLCRTCSQKHHSLLHGCYEKTGDNSAHNTSSSGREPQVSNETVEQAFVSNISVNNDNPNLINNNCMLSKGNSQILLATAKVFLIGENGNKVLARVLLDSASQMSFVNFNVVKALGITRKQCSMQISGIANSRAKVNGSVKLTLCSIHNDFTITASFAILDKITCELPHAKVDVDQVPIPDNLPLADKEFNSPSQIDVLLGADLYYDIIRPGIINLGKNLPKVQNTQLGWVIGGPAPTQSCSLVSLCLFTQSIVNVDDIIPRFWHIEEYPYTKFLAPDDKLCENIFSSTTKRLCDGSFQVDLPLRYAADRNLLGDSFQSSLKRLHSLEKRFARDSNFFKHYKAFVDEYVSLGHAKYVLFNAINKTDVHKNFLPHHAVMKSDKIRVVFDSSMKTSSGYSLNDILLKGPTVQPELFDIVCRFRTYQYVLTADIQKMYRQVKINPSQLNLQNILWRDKPSEPLKCIELQTVTYGTKSAPFLATRCLNQLAEENAVNYPLASYFILNQCYVDDVLAGANSQDELPKLRTELLNLLRLGGFQLHKWSSNDISFGDEPNFSETVFRDPDNKILGLTWDPQNDIFKINSPTLNEVHLFTKRTVLSRIAQVFDPLGFVSPIIIVAKILMQRIWQRKLNWDDELPPDLLQEWKQFQQDIIHLNQVTIPRPLIYSSNYVKLQLCGFCDASMTAYGAVIYLRAVYPDQTVSVNLVCSKSRVAPVKTISLPRLELCGALLLANLANKLKSIFHCNIPDTFLWTDSQVVLHWLHASPSRWTTFVANRISEIQELTINCQWHHVQSGDNPADLISRGTTILPLLTNKLWWNGPAFLHSYDFQPQGNFSVQGLDCLPEQRCTVIHAVNDVNSTEIFSRFSQFIRLQRSIAYCLRFVNNCRVTTKHKLSGILTVEELQQSLKTIVKCVQAKHFASEISDLKQNKPLKNTSLLTLHSFLDKEEILRVGGRIDASEVNFDQRHPMLLPSNAHVVDLLIRQEHIRLHHAGPQAVLANIRLKFWPMNGLRQIKKIILNCVQCHRFRTPQCTQIMGNLPPERVNLVRPFLNVGIDFGGPLKLKESSLRRAKIGKAYIALFVCMSTKAVHLELVSNLSTEAFLLTLKRFIARRGNPKCIFSDNGTNFHGANNQLHDISTFFKAQENREIILNYLSSLEIIWKFIPPLSPHWGGLWEAGIKSTKYHLRRLIGNTALTFEQLTTILTQIESVLNSRPLCPLSSDPSDLACLTPSHFIIGEPLTSFPDKDVTSVPENRLSFWQQCTKVRQHFWKCFYNQYLNRLQHRPKWLKVSDNLKEGMLVLIKEDNTPPLMWVLGRIVSVVPGQDGRVRAVQVKTKSGSFMRPITKLAPLPLN